MERNSSSEMGRSGEADRRSCVLQEAPLYAEYQGQVAVYSIPDGDVLASKIPPKKHNLFWFNLVGLAALVGDVKR